MLNRCEAMLNILLDFCLELTRNHVNYGEHILRYRHSSLNFKCFIKDKIQFPDFYTQKNVIYEINLQ